MKQAGRLRADTGHHRRIWLAAAVLGAAAFVPIGLRLGQLMVVDYGYYAEQARKNQSRTTRVASERGLIFDRNLNILAQNEAGCTVYLNPRELRQEKADIEKIADLLSPLLDVDREKIKSLASDYRKRYTQAGLPVDIQTAGIIRQFAAENNISGIHLEPTFRRVYPYGTLAAQVIGFTNRSLSGCEGIEAAYNSFLEGSPSRVVTTKGNNEMDMPYSYENFLTPQKGCHVILTLDTAIQSILERQLAAAVVRYDVQNGAFGLVMNCKTGEILAMATLGGFDPNDYQTVTDGKTTAALAALEAEYLSETPGTEEYTAAKAAYDKALNEARLKQWRNRVLSDGYEPGSTFKVMTMAAALDTGAIDLNTDFYCRGAEQIPGRAQLLHCWRAAGHGAEKTPQALQNSCNLAFAHIALKLGGERFYEYIERFGILEKTGIDLSGESKGVFFDKNIITDTEKWGTASLTSASFGQTFKITPLQLVRAVASVVNGGTLLEPYVVSEVVDDDGNTLFRQEPTAVRQTVSPETSAVMRQLLASVVEVGTAKNAAVAGYSIGGKTGTSEKIDVFDENGQRVLDKIVSFVGVAPMDDPEYIVLAALDTPSRQSGYYISGGVMAAPTVGAIFAELLPYAAVMKSGEERVAVPDLTGMERREVEKLLKAAGLSPVFTGSGEAAASQNPIPGTEAVKGSQILVYLGEG